VCKNWIFFLINKKILWWGVIIWILQRIDSIIVRKLREKKNHVFDYIMYTITYLKSKPLNSLLCTSISLIFLWSNIHLKTLNDLFRITFQHYVRLPISFYNRIMKEINFISVQLRGIYRFLWKFVLLTVL
jgi:hypothetical protein